VAIALSLLSALSYGIADFLGGLFSRRISPWRVAVVGQTSAAVCTFAAGLLVVGDPNGVDLLWGATGGLGGGLGVVFLYRGFASGRMSVVAPISAVGAALVPVAMGIASGERPGLPAWLGMAIALPAIYLVSRVGGDSAFRLASGGVRDGVLAGVSFGVLFATLGQIGDKAGIMPLALGQVVSVAVVITAAVIAKAAWLPQGRGDFRAAIMGPLTAAAIVSFLYATHNGLLTLVSIIASLYPAATILLAAVFLRERIGRHQGVGLALAGLAVVLVAAG
jgi:uncharacterized membrane protein